MMPNQLQNQYLQKTETMRNDGMFDYRQQQNQNRMLEKEKKTVFTLRNFRTSSTNSETNNFNK